MRAQYHLTLPSLDTDTATGDTAKLLKGLVDAYGFIPNLHARMANSTGLLETYLKGTQRFQNDSGFTVAEQQVVNLTISRFNNCTYCMAAHSFAADANEEITRDIVEAIRNGNAVPDVKLSMLSAFTEIMMESQGKPSNHDVHVFLAAGYDEHHILEIILAIALNTISNFANHVFHTDLDDVFTSRAWVGRL